MKTMMKNRISTGFVLKNINIPVVEFELSGGVKGRGLIDTGSESTMLDLNFLKQNRSVFAIDVTNQKMNFVGFYGDEDKHLIRVSTYVHFGKRAVGLKNAIATQLDNINKSLEDMYGKDMHIDVVFGSDFFIDHRLEINYKTKQIIFND